jgi:hypothetical protein
MPRRVVARLLHGRWCEGVEGREADTGGGIGGDDREWIDGGLRTGCWHCSAPACEAACQHYVRTHRRPSESHASAAIWRPTYFDRILNQGGEHAQFMPLPYASLCFVRAIELGWQCAMNGEVVVRATI